MTRRHIKSAMIRLLLRRAAWSRSEFMQTLADEFGVDRQDPTTRSCIHDLREDGILYCSLNGRIKATEQRR